MSSSQMMSKDKVVILVFELQATMEAIYLLAQSVLYVCIVYFSVGFAKEAGQPHDTLWTMN